MMRKYFVLWLLLVIVTGCRSSKVTAPEASHSSTPPANSVIYMIHGDANYLYHNANGYPLQADEQVLKEAKKVAESATKSEVFIFHQKSEEKILWLFPKKDRRFLYYRNGKLIADQRYSPRTNDQSFGSEKKLYNRFKAVVDTTSSRKIFLYFGHEIPESDHSYHLSRPKANFNRDVFVKGVGSFVQSPDSSFDLTVLSTCDNGTPAMVHALSPLSRYVLASPQNLHLSHIDTRGLASMLDDTKYTSREIADSLAGQTYQRLAGFLQTVITLAVYETNVTDAYMSTFNRAYDRYISERTGSLSVDNTDCGSLSFFEAKKYTDGVEVWYKAPQFGVRQDASNHSGWGCAARAQKKTVLSDR